MYRKTKSFFFILRDTQNKLIWMFVMFSILSQKHPYKDIFLKYEMTVKEIESVHEKDTFAIYANKVANTMISW